MLELLINDVRAKMPNYNTYAHVVTDRIPSGIAIHHSAQAHPVLGLSTDDAASIFEYHTRSRGWNHGGYHYVIGANGQIEYALDERITGYHAYVHDPDDALKLEHGQYWNHHYLAICVLGWFDVDRAIIKGSHTHGIPNRFTKPTERQMQALIGLVRRLQAKYGIETEKVRGHRELAGCATQCPGANLDVALLREALC